VLRRAEGNGCCGKDSRSKEGCSCSEIVRKDCCDFWRSKEYDCMLGKVAEVSGRIWKAAAFSVEIRKRNCDFRRKKECGCMFRRSWEMKLRLEEEYVSNAAACYKRRSYKKEAVLFVGARKTACVKKS
jgi:hypothetical protein